MNMRIPRRFVLAGLAWSALSPARATPLTRSLKEIRERGVVMQKWENSCAAASLATVLTYGFGDPVSEKWVAQKMLQKTDPAKVRKQGGFSLLDMKQLVDELGYTGSAYKHLRLEHLMLFHAPIVPINPHGFNHYVVFFGMQDGRVLLADPAFGRRHLSREAFESQWMDGMAFLVSH
jgi:predicted double-glycine peptidase